MPSPQPTALLLLLFAAAACKPEAAPTTPEPAPTSEPAPAQELTAEPAAPDPEPPPPDHSELIGALDALDAALEGCHGQLGTKKGSGCSDAVSAAGAGLTAPVESSTMAADLATGQHEIQTQSEKLTKAVDGHKHKDQHHHLDELARLSKDMRAKVPQ